MHFLLCYVFKHSWSACPDPPTSLNVGQSMAQRKRRTLVAPDMNLSLDQSEGSVLSDDFLETPDDLDINVDDIETPDETDSLEFINNGNELEWEGQTTMIILERGGMCVGIYLRSISGFSLKNCRQLSNTAKMKTNSDTYLPQTTKTVLVIQ